MPYRPRIFWIVLLVAGALPFAFDPAGAQWTGEGVALCTTEWGRNPLAVSDGAGGAIVAWQDERSGDEDVYVQRVSSSGVVQWSPDGVPLCVTAGQQQPLGIVSDAMGGAIVSWQVFRVPYYYDIYAQRVNAAGEPLWTTNGLLLCTTEFEPAQPSVASDGVGGAIVAWSSMDYPFIRAQRVSAAGVPLWADGVGVYEQPANGLLPATISDGAGGAIVAWEDHRQSKVDIYAQRVNASGSLQWTPAGVAVCTALDDQEYPRIVSDGAGGAIVTWEDHRNVGAYSEEIYAQRISATGVPQWTNDGIVALSRVIVSDGAGGAIYPWSQDPYGPTSYDIYAQRVDATGAPQWGGGGVPVCVAPDVQPIHNIAISSDGAGGAVMAWDDDRDPPTARIFAQRIGPGGMPQWIADGVPLCTKGVQVDPTIAADGVGGALVAWVIQRSGTSPGQGAIYAGRVPPNGEVVDVAPIASPDVIEARAWPNPFTEHVLISFRLSVPTPVRMEVFDALGRRVWTSPTTLLGAGRNTLEWDGRAADGNVPGNGIYFLTVRGSNVDARRRVIRLR